MASDPFKIVRAHLAGARLSLEASKREASGLIVAIANVEHVLDPTHGSYIGEPAVASNHLRTIVAELTNLKRPWPAIATGFDPLKQDPEPQLLPGVAGAIQDIGRALALLSPDKQSASPT
jgi:hypothetical protein